LLLETNRHYRHKLARFSSIKTRMIANSCNSMGKVEVCEPG
jgi:hypothetical protein